VTYFIPAGVDVAELNLPKTCRMEFANPDDLLNFKLIIMPDEVNHITVQYHKLSLQYRAFTETEDLCLTFK